MRSAKGHLVGGTLHPVGIASGTEDAFAFCSGRRGFALTFMRACVFMLRRRKKLESCVVLEFFCKECLGRHPILECGELFSVRPTLFSKESNNVV